MAEAKSPAAGSGTPRRSKKAKTSAAFGKLNALSASGALSKINNETGKGSSPATATQPTEAAPASVVGAPEPAADFAEPEPTESAPQAPSVTTPAEPAANTPRPAPEPGGAVGPRELKEAPFPTPGSVLPQETERSPADGSAASLVTAGSIGRQPGPKRKEPASASNAVAVRRTAPPSLPTTSGYSERRLLEALPPQLADKVEGLPVAYLELAKSYRRAQATRTGTKPAKRNIRLHAEVATAVNHQLVSDKRMLGLRNLKPSQYVDAAVTLARGVSVDDLIRAADEFRDSHLGEESSSASPNHYSISRENDAWLDDMMDELLLANTTGLHGHMINVIIQSFLEQLRVEAPIEG
jgi:hypothetical protein